MKLFKSYISYKDKVNGFISSYYNYILTILIQQNRMLNNRSNNKSNNRSNLPNEILVLIKEYGIIMCGKYD